MTSEPSESQLPRNTEGKELPIITKVYDLILWTVNHTAKFPHSHRFSLGLRIENMVYDILNLLIEAKFNRDKEQLLNDTNIKLEQLRFQVRMAKDFKVLSIKQYGFFCSQVTEIGNMLGGWRKSVRQSPTRR